MIIKRDFIYTPKGKNRPLHIYLPEGYFESEDRYPVMYFFDGHNLFFDEDATYGKSWGMKEFLDTWEKEMIVVGIECGHDGEERLSEYLPYTANKSTYFGQFEPTGDATMQWILSEVKPMIDLEYRTIPFRECTAIAGSSMGGLMALYAVTHYNRWFSKGGCVSSAVGFCMRPLMSDLRKSSISPDTSNRNVFGHYIRRLQDFSTASCMLPWASRPWIMPWAEGCQNPSSPPSAWAMRRTDGITWFGP